MIKYRNAAGETAYLIPEQLVIAAAGAEAGRVWKKGASNITPASPEEIAAADEHIPGFAAARAACEAVRQ